MCVGSDTHRQVFDFGFQGFSDFYRLSCSCDVILEAAYVCGFISIDFGFCSMVMCVIFTIKTLLEPLGPGR